MGHHKAERAVYHNGIRGFWSFGQSETQKLCSVQPLFCPEAEFSNKVELQNVINSKPFSGQSRMSSG
jgi:hypothetical protein